MSLKKYRQKRDFSVTPEPRGRRLKKTDDLLYLIQKHDASHLHYDLRLELNGVLKSWAVPKGPSLDPSIKRLAIEVEDHPLEYGSFEGIIPKGEYGGGTVMLWDTGTWSCEGDPEEEFKKGHLSFTLHGQKLQGKWRLIKTKNKQGNKNSWLLFKVNDKYAKKNYDILAKKPLSVLSHHNLKEISLASNDLLIEIKKLSHVRKKSQPKQITPQLATLVKEPPAKEDWLHEIKFDGYRIICVIKNKKIQLMTRHGLDWSDKFSAVLDYLKTLPLKNGILDGELVAFDETNNMSFQALQNFLEKNKKTRLKYYIFDIPYYLGYDLTQTPLIERKQFLQFLFTQWGISKNSSLEYTDHILGQGETVFQKACELGLEGIISKQINSRYEEHRTRSWLKCKCIHRQEFVIGGFSKPKKSRQFFGALLLGYYDKKKQLIYCGRVGTGFTQDSLQSIFKKLEPLIQNQPSFYNPPTGREAKDVIWIKPKLVVEIAFGSWTSDNILRQAAFLGLRKDKSTKEIHKEIPANLSSLKQQAKIADVTISHAQKILYPQNNISKQDLADYYDEISDWILPHIVHRPLVLLRCPAGIDDECFFQKNFEIAMKYTKIIPIKDRKGTINYLSIANKSGLLSLVQLGVLEIHPWGCRDDEIEKPDRISFDLDPGPDVAWEEVIQGAFYVRDRLASLGLESYVKTSGGKGLHVVIPFKRRWHWEEIKEFTQAFAITSAQEYPEKFTATVSKSKRQGKIFIDYLRNARGATAVAAYSTRARPHAPVSMPVPWQELKSVKSSVAYTLSNVPEHLRKIKQDPWEGFFKCNQSITKSMKVLLRI